MIHNPAIECMSREDMRKLQTERLIQTVKTCYEKVPFYKKKFDEMGLKPEDIRSLDDITKLPFTTKYDLRDEYPFGLNAVPMDQIVRIHASSGTTGKPTVVGYTKNDLDMWSNCMARLVMAAGATDEDIVQISFGYGMFTGALGLHYGLEKIGATVVPNSSGNTEKALMYMRDFHTTALVSTPSYALYMAETAKELGYPMSDYHLRLGLFGSEGCTPEMRAQVEKGWGLFATDNYGMSELVGPGVSGECRERDGLHFNEDYFYPEIVDSETLEPQAPGETGELLVTTLCKEGLPLLRYRTKDITHLDYSPCACGRTTARMAKIEGRTDDMLIISGVNVFPSQIEEVLLSIDGIGSNYLITVSKKGYLDKIDIDVEVGAYDLLDSVTKLDALYAEIKTKLHTILGIHPTVHLVEPKSLKRSEGKAKRVLDLRNEK